MGMSFPKVHFLREVLVSDYQGTDVPTMQSSDSNADALHPYYTNASFYEHDDLRTLYHQLGGGRREGAALGSTVVIPNRSGWANLRRITAAEVTILAAPNAPPTDPEAAARHKRRTQARDAAARN